MIDMHKICFITCVDDEIYYKESLLYLQQLKLLPGMRTEFIAIRGAESMTSGYNKAMGQSNAKYKVYLHQDVFLINKNYVEIIEKLFRADQSIGLIGAAGCKKLPVSGVWWKASEKYGQICHSYEPESIRQTNYGSASGPYCDVQAVDGLLMATQYDIPWREDLFTGWHFYDIAQSLEFQRQAYRVIVPQQTTPWCVHATGSKELGSTYQQYRQVFLREYDKEFLDKEEFDVK
jgi:hypothetical protein